MGKKRLCILLLAVFGALRLFAVENLTFQGKMQLETAVSLTPVEEAAFIKGETALDLVLKHFAGPFRFYAALEGRYDTLTGGEGEAELTEAYVAADFDKTSLVAGKIWVSWGRADEVNPVDVVNPEDYREPVVAEKEERKIRIPAFTVSRYLGDWTLTGVLVPSFTPPALETSPHWQTSFYKLLEELKGAYLAKAVALSVPPYALEDYVMDHLFFEDHEAGLSDVQFGGRLNGYLGALDISLYYYNGYWTDMSRPAISMRGFDPLFPALPEKTVVCYPRFQMAGADFATVLGAFTLRGEGAWYLGRKITYDLSQMGDPRFWADGGWGETDVVKFVVGLDRFWGDLYVNIQYIGEVITDYNSLMMLPADYLQSMTLNISWPLSDGRWEPELKLLWEETENDFYAGPRLTHELYNGIHAYAGADIFTGDSEGTLGQYRECDRFYTGLTYSF